MHTKIQFCHPQTERELQQILDLQALNLPDNISSEELKQQGYVTVKHNLELLSDMNSVVPQVIAKADDQVVGYALVMVHAFQDKIPVLIPMFQRLAQLTYQGSPMTAYNYYVMGQVCIAKAYRGQGIFDSLFQFHRQQFSNEYDFMVTQISEHNPRSIAAHRRVGFKLLHAYVDPGVDDWEIVIWDWREH
ncbi:MAG: hypothetical protein DHS20C18_50630 [Saprospiraceae bacterium]|nr:MAG: hypothetical protein DHS20C18_50630 [Saprospiraceae bacterium]